MNEDKIQIYVDSASDMLPDEAKKYGIKVIPLRIFFGDDEYRDGETISRDEFYKRMEESKTLPKTSLVSPFIYGEYFKEAIESGKEVICLTLSSSISGSFQSASLAAKDFDGKASVIDTRQFCGSEYLLAIRAAKLRDEGKSRDEIVEQIEKEKNEVKIISIFNTLENLKLGGRISAAVAYIGNKLAIKPIITIGDGVVKVIRKIPGLKIAMLELNRIIDKDGGIDQDMPILLSYTGNDDLKIKQFKEGIESHFKGLDLSKCPVSRVGAAIGTYAGSGAVAISFFPKKK